jgi:hypothetical protein
MFNECAAIEDADQKFASIELAQGGPFKVARAGSAGTGSLTIEGSTLASALCIEWRAD